jgi:hypothetical protein
MDKWSEYQDYIQDRKVDIEEQHGDLILYQYFDTLQWGYRYAIVLEDKIIQISEDYPFDVMYGAEKTYKILKGENI